MSKESVLKTLADLGLKKTEAKVYFFLAKKGPKKAKEITNVIGITKQRLYPILKQLEKKAIINPTLNRPAKFEAISYEKLLDLFAKTKLEEANILQQNKGKLLSDWKSINPQSNTGNSVFFTRIQGRKYVYSKIKQMIQETKHQFSVISTISDLFRAEQQGILDFLQNHPNKKDVVFRIITDIPSNYIQAVKELLATINPQIKVKSRNSNLGLSLFPRMILRDNEEILYFISTNADDPIEQENQDAFFTNCNSLVNPLSNVFKTLWRNSTNINQKILEIETGISPRRTEIIGNENIAYTQFNEILRGAKKEVIIVTSSEDILSYWRDSSFLKKLSVNGVLVKIMAPVSHANLTACLKLSKFCEVRHVPNEYLKTITIDGKHFFQFNLKNELENKGINRTFKGTLYSNDLEYVEKTNKMFYELWKNSVIPTSSTVESVIKEQTSMSDKNYNRMKKYKFVDRVSTINELNNITKRDKITEQDIREKISEYKTSSKRRHSDSVIACGIIGHALIHPHKNFDYPKLLLSSFKLDKESSFGAEEAIVIHCWINTSSGGKYIPVAVVGNNPKASTAWISRYKNTNAPAFNNYTLFKRDEVQIQSHGRTLFASWNKPIHILPNQDPLPPSALILEGIGKLKPQAFDILQSNGLKDMNRFNYWDAFITFLHEDTKYQGPATEGILSKDSYVETIFPRIK